MKKAKKAKKSILGVVIENLYAGEIIGEWVRCLKMGKGPEIFANLYLEVMKDPEDARLRRDASAFLVFADTRGWMEILEKLEPVIDESMLKVLRTSHAEEFYNTWKYMVRSQVADYWQQFVKASKKTG